MRLSGYVLFFAIIGTNVQRKIDQPDYATCVAEAKQVAKRLPIAWVCYPSGEQK